MFSASIDLFHFEDLIAKALIDVATSRIALSSAYLSFK